MKGHLVPLFVLSLSLFPITLHADSADQPNPEVLVTGVEGTNSRFLKTFLGASVSEFPGGFANTSAKAFTGVMEDVFLGGIDRARTAGLALYDPAGRASLIGYVPLLDANVFKDSMKKNGLIFGEEKDGIYELSEKFGAQQKFLGYVKLLGAKHEYAAIGATREELAQITEVPALEKGADGTLAKISWAPAAEVSGEVGRKARKLVDSLPKYEGESAALYRQRKGLARKIVGVAEEAYLDLAGFEMQIEPTTSESPSTPGMRYFGEVKLVPDSELAASAAKFAKISNAFAGVKAEGTIGIANASFPLTSTQADMLESEAEYVHALLKETLKKSTLVMGKIKPIEVKVAPETKALLTFENDLSQAVVIDAAHAEAFSGVIVTRGKSHVAGTKVTELDPIRDVINEYVDSKLITALDANPTLAGVDLFEVAVGKQLTDAFPEIYAGVPKLFVALEATADGARVWYATGEKALEELTQTIVQARAAQAPARPPVFVDYSLSPLASAVNRIFGVGGVYEIESADRKLLDRLTGTLQKVPHNNVEFRLEPKTNALSFEVKVGSGVIKAVSAATIATLGSVGF